MTTVAFIGLGIMGGPMAANLVTAGFDVTGHTRSPEPVQRLVERGGRGAGSLAEAVRDADVVVTMVPDSPDVEAVTIGEDGFYGVVKPGTLHVDMSSIRPDVAKKVADAGKERGVRSEEHTSELQSRQYLVCRLLLVKKNTQRFTGPCAAIEET